jgi:hypothetical protein
MAQAGMSAPIPDVQRGELVAVACPVQHPSPREIVHIPKHRFSV